MQPTQKQEKLREFQLLYKDSNSVLEGRSRSHVYKLKQAVTKSLNFELVDINDGDFAELSSSIDTLNNFLEHTKLEFYPRFRGTTHTSKLPYHINSYINLCNQPNLLSEGKLNLCSNITDQADFVAQFNSTVKLLKICQLHSEKDVIQHVNEQSKERLKRCINTNDLIGTNKFNETTTVSTKFLTMLRSLAQTCYVNAISNSKRHDVLGQFDIRKESDLGRLVSYSMEQL